MRAAWFRLSMDTSKQTLQIHLSFVSEVDWAWCTSETEWVYCCEFVVMSLCAAFQCSSITDCNGFCWLLLRFTAHVWCKHVVLVVVAFVIDCLLYIYLAQAILSQTSCLVQNHASFIYIFTRLPATLNSDSSIMPSSGLLFQDNNW